MAGWRGAGFYQLEPFVDQDLAGHFAERRSGHIVVAREAVEVYFGQNIAEGVVGEAEEQVVGAAHFALNVEADVWQGLAGNREDLRVSEVNQVEPYPDCLLLAVGILERRARHHGPHLRRLHGNGDGRT